MEPAASNFVEGVDLAFKVIFGIGLFFLVGITAVMIYFVIRYNRKRHPKPEQIKDNNLLEITWTVIPLILVLLMFYYGYEAFKPMREVPEGAMPVKVISRMWEWVFEYENGKQAPVLVVPINKPVKLDLTSEDVIHSLYIPAFRIKEDLVPGTENYMWFIPQELGEYEILCAEYCGLRHSYMESKVVVVSEDRFVQWLDSLPDKSMQPAGLTILKDNACLSCHSLDGTKLVGPSFKGIFGKRHEVITDGKEKTIRVDKEYLRTSIFDPDKEITKGFSKGLMKTYKGKITEEQVDQMIDYLKTVK